MRKVRLCYFLCFLLICILHIIYVSYFDTVKSSAYFFMIGFSVLFQECSNHIWKCPLPTVDQKLSNSNQGQETQLEEYVYISMTDHSRSFSLQRGNLFLIWKPFLSILAPLGERFSSEYPNLRNLTQIPALLITLELKPSLAASLPTWGSLSIFSLDSTAVSIFVVKPARVARGPEGPARWER